MKKFLLTLTCLIAFSTVGANAQSNAETDGNNSANTVAPKDVSAFTLKDIDGKDFNLSSLKGKIVVLDFWGSWCPWCIKGIPDMKKTYAKYKDKGLEIVSVDCRDTDAKWREAVAKYELPWINIYNPRGEGDITKMFEIQGYPTKIVISREGKIINTIIGEDPAFYTYIDGLFN
jgi:thiol-disulfide isomerase/thioredoxin